MATHNVRLVYPKQLVDEPVLYRLVRQFDLVTNVRHAEIREDGGSLDLELRGDDAAIGRALDWVRSQGILVEET